MRLIDIFFGAFLERTMGIVGSIVFSLSFLAAWVFSFLGFLEESRKAVPSTTSICFLIFISIVVACLLYFFGIPSIINGFREKKM